MEMSQGQILLPPLPATEGWEPRQAYLRRFRIEGAGLAAGNPGGSFIAHPNGRLSE